MNFFDNISQRIAEIELNHSLVLATPMWKLVRQALESGKLVIIRPGVNLEQHLELFVEVR